MKTTRALPLRRQVLATFKQPFVVENKAGASGNEGLTGAAAGKRLSDLSTRYGRVTKATRMKAE
jgi:tripartite-type tricarboxylate transporter receptor subunit TctC